MPFCELCWRAVKRIELHRNTTPHQLGKIIKCNGCCLWFCSKAARARHRKSSGCVPPPVSISQFHCCDCNQDFSSRAALTIHLGNKSIHPPRVVVALALSAAYCEKCEKIFGSQARLEQHLASVIHNPIMESMTCLGGNGCKKKFHTPSGMLAHLESGACASGLTRTMIDDLVIANDPTNIITDPVAVETMFQNRMMIAPGYTSSTDGSSMFTPSETSNTVSEWWEDIYTPDRSSSGTVTPCNESFDFGESEIDSDDFQFTTSGTATPTIDRSSNSISGYRSTPSISSDSGSGVFLTPSYTSSEIFTPSEASFSSQLIPSTFTCSLCPAQNARKYTSINELNTHMRSQVHASRIYRCPSPSLTSGSGYKSTGKERKSFAALSGLAQHVEAGACDGGKQTLNDAISLVNEKLRNMGVNGVKLMGH